MNQNTQKTVLTIIKENLLGLEQALLVCLLKEGTQAEKLPAEATDIFFYLSDQFEQELNNKIKTLPERIDPVASGKVSSFLESNFPPPFRDYLNSQFINTGLLDASLSDPNTKEAFIKALESIKDSSGTTIRRLGFTDSPHPNVVRGLIANGED